MATLSIYEVRMQDKVLYTSTSFYRCYRVLKENKTALIKDRITGNETKLSDEPIPMKRTRPPAPVHIGGRRFINPEYSGWKLKPLN